MAQSAYDKAVSLLAIREHTKKELKEKLENKGFQEAEISSSLERLEKEGYISEERFAEVFIRSRLKKSPEGYTLILCRLMEKGCPRDIAYRALDEAWENKLWLDPLKKELESLTRRKGDTYALVKMRQKGFSNHEIKEAKKQDE
ncbi:MAG: recombination regulator RecX [Spirochaetales bacterium]|nr:recombination regulator RecX [Spirochaetales bacterium]